MSVPLGMLTVRTFLYTYICSIISQILFVDEPMLYKLIYVYAVVSAHTLKLFVYIYSQVNSYHGIDDCVYEPKLYKLTYVYAFASAHT